MGPAPEMMTHLTVFCGPGECLKWVPCSPLTRCLCAYTFVLASQPEPKLREGM